MSVQLGQHMCFGLGNPKLAGRTLDIDPDQMRGTFAAWRRPTGSPPLNLPETAAAGAIGVLASERPNRPVGHGRRSVGTNLASGLLVKTTCAKCFGLLFPC